MGQVKIYGLEENINRNRDIISSAIHKSIVEALQFPEDKKFQRFIKLSADDFVFPESRSEKYLIIEIVMFAGRSDDTKKQLIKLLFENLKKINIDENDVEIVLFEEPPINWGIRGCNGEDLKINYKVDI